MTVLWRLKGTVSHDFVPVLFLLFIMVSVLHVHKASIAKVVHCTLLLNMLTQLILFSLDCSFKVSKRPPTFTVNVSVVIVVSA